MSEDSGDPNDPTSLSYRQVPASSNSITDLLSGIGMPAMISDPPDGVSTEDDLTGLSAVHDAQLQTAAGIVPIDPNDPNKPDI
jgi:hypothetical protein